jgi:hypothetical protein
MWSERAQGIGKDQLTAIPRNERWSRIIVGVFVALVERLCNASSPSITESIIPRLRCHKVNTGERKIQGPYENEMMLDEHDKKVTKPEVPCWLRSVDSNA